MKLRILASSLAIAASLLAAPAAAATFDLNLTADPANLVTGTFTIGPDTYRTGELATSTFAPFTISQGDIIRTVLTLTAPLTVPGSMEQLFGLNFWQGSYGSPHGNASTAGTLTFSYSGGSTGLVSDTLPGGCGNCLTAISGNVPGGPFTFDQLIVEQTITTLDDPFTIDNATFSYQLRDWVIVPEPATWMTLILGFAVIGSAMRRRPGALRLALGG